MKVEIEQFESGWQSLSLGLTSIEIDKLIVALQQLRSDQDHFHFRSSFEGVQSIGDIEIYYQTSEQSTDLVLEISDAIYSK